MPDRPQNFLGRISEASDLIGNPSTDRTDERTSERYRIGEFELDAREATLHGPDDGQRDEISRSVRRQPLAVLLLLIQNRDRIVTRDDLTEAVWDGAFVSEGTISTAISDARRVLGDDGRQQRFIRTVHGRGFQWVAPTERIDAPSIASPTSSELRRLFVGREASMASLHDALLAAQAGRPSLFLVEGEMGIGKSRLAEEFCAHARDMGLGVALGRSESHEGAPAFWPWTQILRALVEGIPAEEIPPLFERGAREVQGLLPGLFADSGPVDEVRHGAPLDRFRLFDAVSLFLRRVCNRQPLLVILEDLHGIDEGSLQLLRFLAQGLHDQRIVLVATTRIHELPDSDPRAQQLMELRQLTQALHSIPLGPLSRDAVLEFGRHASGSMLSDDVGQALYERSGGNPFFMHELVSHLATEHGQLAFSSTLLVDQSLPRSLEEAVSTRLKRQTAELQRLLTLASVLGRDFGMRGLQELSGSNQADVVAGLADALRTDLIETHPSRPGHYRFTHVLVRETLYRRLSQLELADLHSRVVDFMERVHEGKEEEHAFELAEHSLRSALVDGNERALRYCHLAAARAERRGAHEAAAQHYKALLSAAEIGQPIEEESRCDVMIALSGALIRSGRRDEARDLVASATDLARRIGAPRLFANAVLAFEPGFLDLEVASVDEKIMSLVREALVSLDPSDVGIRNQLWARLALLLYQAHRDAERTAFANQLERESTPFVDDESELHYTCARYWACWSVENLRARLDLTQKILTLAQARSAFETVLLYRLIRIITFLEAGDIGGLERETEAYEQLARELRQPQSLWYTLLLRGQRLLLSGQFDQVEDNARRYLALAGSMGDVNAVQSYGGQVATASYELGDVEKACALVGFQSDRFRMLAAWHASYSILLFKAGRADEARREFEIVAAENFGTIEQTNNWLPALAMATETCILLEDVERARILYDLLAPFEDRVSTAGFGTICWGSIARHLGQLAHLLGEFDRAEVHFREALDRNQRIGAVQFIVRTCVEYARMLCDRGGVDDHKTAAPLVQRARQIAQKCSIRILEPDILELEERLRG